MDAEDRALVEDAHLLNELTKHPGWARLVERSLVLMRKDKQRVLDGVVVHLEDYRKMTGFFQGAHAVLDLPSVVEELAGNARRRAAERNEDDAA